MDSFKRKIEEAVKGANFNLRRDVLLLLKKAYKSESNKRAKLALGWIIKNSQIAKRENLALCQDTGLPLVFIQVGKKTKLSLSLVEKISREVQASYRRNYLRASMVEPLKRGRPGYQGISFYIEFNPALKGLEIVVFPKGFGSENKSQLKMFDPTASLEEIEEFILKVVREAGPEACPPFIIGVGIGGSSDSALLLAKKALVERIDKPNKDKFLASWERKLLKRINSLKIGPMGFGGKTTALGVKIKTSPTHIAGLPVGVNISCWALRSATVKIQ